MLAKSKAIAESKIILFFFVSVNLFLRFSCCMIANIVEKSKQKLYSYKNNINLYLSAEKKQEGSTSCLIFVYQAVTTLSKQSLNESG